jgi:hypothetical protein
VSKLSQRQREVACQCAAEVMASRPSDPLAPTLWSVTVFFESYLAHGATWTQKDFGPKPPAKLKIVAGQPNGAAP